MACLPFVSSLPFPCHRAPYWSVWRDSGKPSSLCSQHWTLDVLAPQVCPEAGSSAFSGCSCDTGRIKEADVLLEGVRLARGVDVSLS